MDLGKQLLHGAINASIFRVEVSYTIRKKTSVKICCCMLGFTIFYPENAAYFH